MLSFRGVFKSRKELTCTTEHVIITPAHESGISPGGCVRERYTPYVVRANSREEFDTILNRGKPSDEADAARMLRELQGRTHCVCTAVAVYMPGGERRDFAVKSYVRFRRMSAEDIRRYLSEVYVLDKAGAYAMQEKSELIVESVEGDVDNVIGLPVRQLPEVLRRA